MEQNWTTISELVVSNPLESSARPSSSSSWTEPIERRFPRRRKLLKQKKWPKVETIEQKNSLTIEQFKEFLHEEQQMKSISIDECAKLIQRFEPSDEGRQYDQIGIDGLRLFLLHDDFCLLNPSKVQHIYQDMRRPLTDYFIATSHNT